MNEVEHAVGKIGEWTERRDDAIRTMRAEGHSLRQIAGWAQLSHTAVATITKGASDGRP